MAERRNRCISARAMGCSVVQDGASAGAEVVRTGIRTHWVASQHRTFLISSLAMLHPHPTCFYKCNSPRDEFLVRPSCGGHLRGQQNGKGALG
jgi:hypothetical protein